MKVKPVSRRRFRATTLALLAGLTALPACSGEFTREEAISSFSQAHPDVTAEQSSCVVDRLLERYTLEGLEAELETDPINPDFEEAQFRDMFACGVEGDVRQQLTEQLAAEGVAEDKAPCVADTLVADMDDGDIDVLLSGEINDAFYQKFFDAMETCGAVNQ